MAADDQVVINEELSIPESELSFSFSTSGGPGGQHANRSATRAILSFDVYGSPSLSDGQRARILARLGNRISHEGTMQISAGESRSQYQNRQEAIARFQALLERALRPQKKRRPTRPSRAAQERRLEAKRRRGQRKAERQKRWRDLS
ncbi:MAG: aminoacyl-tRNA hydrolase [Chloroflexi bacterium]|jgi:ribosome-associated protein|nr:aminoacyl-tRNA hydrolase [Chloroflexota bacterium]